MKIKKTPKNIHKAYHAHIYFDQKSKELTKQICAEITTKFHLKVGRMHERPIGPHPEWSVQVIFGTRDFDRFLTWLDAKRQGLSVLVHGLTGNDYQDHTDYAYWLGDSVELNLDAFKVDNQ